MTELRQLSDDEIACASGAFACYYPMPLGFDPLGPFWPFPPTFPEPIYE